MIQTYGAKLMVMKSKPRASGDDPDKGQMACRDQL